MPTYKDYRACGHGPVVSFTLASPIRLWYGGAFVIGILLGLVPPAGIKLLMELVSYADM